VRRSQDEDVRAAAAAGGDTELIASLRLFHFSHQAVRNCSILSLFITRLYMLVAIFRWI